MRHSHVFNGPILLIVCSSCKQAQLILDYLMQILDIVSCLASRDALRRRSSELKCLMIQGGGMDVQYDVPLSNGCDILIAATPYAILRKLGDTKTNLERLKYLVFEETHILVSWQYALLL